MRRLLAIAFLTAACDNGDEADTRRDPPEPSTLIETTEYGTFRLEGSSKEPLELEIEDEISATLVLEVDELDPVTATIAAPDQTLLVEAPDPFGSRNPAIPSPRIFAVLLPDSSLTSFDEGTYTITPRYFGKGATEVRGRAFRKRHMAVSEDRLPPDEQTYDIHLFFATPGVDERDEEVQTALDRMIVTLQAAGLFVNDIESISIDVPDEERFLVLDPLGIHPDVWSLFRRSEEAASDGLNLFFVEDMEAGASGLVVVGLAGNIPIPPVRGTDLSGVAVSIFALRQAPNLTGLVMAHEAAHAFGLFHTTERDFSATDPLDDTPECPPSADENSDGRVAFQECLGQDAQNLMFPIAEPTADAILTEDQGIVLRSSALAR